MGIDIHIKAVPYHNKAFSGKAQKHDKFFTLCSGLSGMATQLNNTFLVKLLVIFYIYLSQHIQLLNGKKFVLRRASKLYH